MRLVPVELSSRVAVFSMLFGATALQLFPIAGLGIVGLTTKHLLIFSLMGYLFFGVVLKKKGRLQASQELLAFVTLYVVCILSLLLNGIFLPPGDAYIEGIAEFSYLVPLLFALYHLFQTHFELRERFLRSIAVVMYTTIVAFILFFSAKANIDIISAFKSFFSGSSTLQYKLFALTFSYVNEDAGSAARHTMMYLFFLLLVLIRVSRKLEADPSGRAAFTGAELVLVLTIVVIGMSRKVVLALFVFFILYNLVNSRFSVSKTSYGHMKSLVILVGFSIALIVGIGSLDADALELFRHKYIEQVLNNDRIHQYVLSVDEVTGSLRLLIAGVGLGERISGDTHFPHNVLFYFLHQAGLIGLLSALALYGFLALLMIKTLFMAFRSKSRNASYIALASLACFLVPFTRMTVGATGGLAMEGALGLTLGMVLLRRAIRVSHRRPILVSRAENYDISENWQVRHSL